MTPDPPERHDHRAAHELEDLRVGPGRDRDVLAGRLRGEINLAAQNGLYLVLLLLGGMIIPFGKLPGGLRSAAHVLPSGALADVLRDALAGAGTDPTQSWLILAAWAVVAPALAARLFRWDA